MEPLEPIYENILETFTSRDSPGSFTIVGEAEKNDHLTNAVLHCYILISLGLISTTSQCLESCDGEIILRDPRD